MRTKRDETTFKVWLSARETADWATSWPCSTIGGHRLFAEFQRGDLVDLALDGCLADCDAHELNAIIEDFCGSARPGE